MINLAYTKATSLGFVLIALTACAKQPAAAPTALDVATVAVNTVDIALSVYIDVSPVNDAGAYPDLEPLVIKVEHAAAIVRSAGEVCEVLPDLAAVARVIGCAKCAAPIAAAQEQLKCQ